MPGSRTGVRSQLYEVVLLLASDKGWIEDRLRDAYFSHIRSLDITELPPDARFKLEWIRAELKTLYPTRDAACDRKTAVGIAQSIILLYDALHP